MENDDYILYTDPYKFQMGFNKPKSDSQMINICIGNAFPIIVKNREEFLPVTLCSNFPYENWLYSVGLTPKDIPRSYKVDFIPKNDLIEI